MYVCLGRDEAYLCLSLDNLQLTEHTPRCMAVRVADRASEPSVPVCYLPDSTTSALFCDSGDATTTTASNLPVTKTTRHPSYRLWSSAVSSPSSPWTESMLALYALV